MRPEGANYKWARIFGEELLKRITMLLLKILLAFVPVGLVIPISIAAQQAKLPKIGFLALARFVPPKLFLDDLANQGFVDGKGHLDPIPLCGRTA